MRSNIHECLHSAYIALILLLTLAIIKFGGITVNPFEGEGMNCRRNQATDAAVGFAVPFLAFTIMFAIAVIIDFATK